VIRGVHEPQLGPIDIRSRAWDASSEKRLFSADPDNGPELEAYMIQLRRDQNSVVRKNYCSRRGWCPLVLGASRYFPDRLDGRTGLRAEWYQCGQRCLRFALAFGFSSPSLRHPNMRDKLTPPREFYQQ